LVSAAAVPFLQFWAPVAQGTRVPGQGGFGDAFKCGTEGDTPRGPRHLSQGSWRKLSQAQNPDDKSALLKLPLQSKETDLETEIDEGNPKASSEALGVAAAPGKPQRSQSSEAV